LNFFQCFGFTLGRRRQCRSGFGQRLSDLGLCLTPLFAHLAAAQIRCRHAAMLLHFLQQRHDFLSRNNRRLLLLGGSNQCIGTAHVEIQRWRRQQHPHHTQQGEPVPQLHAPQNLSYPLLLPYLVAGNASMILFVLPLSVMQRCRLYRSDAIALRTHNPPGKMNAKAICGNGTASPYCLSAEFTS